MLIRDIDRKLDMRLILKVKQTTELFGAIADMKVRLPVFIYMQNFQTWMATYFPKDVRDQKTHVILGRFKAVERSDSYVVNTRINNVREMEVITKLSTLPSFMIDGSDMSEGYVNVYGRFHSSQLENVSELLSEHTSDPDSARIEFLGPTPGIMRIMDMINSSYPLSLVSFVLPVDGELNPISKLFGRDIIAAAKSGMRKGGGFTVVLYSNGEIQDKIPGLTPIAAKDGVYELYVELPFLSMIREEANKAHIMRFRFFIKPFRNALEVHVLLPSSSVLEYYSIILDVARKSGHKVSIKYVMPYSQDIWNYV
ncbi:MAG TPA: hypothetical protein VKU79_01490 [Thermoplasmataceae archaeon]|nr:hypothetical protein [Thermoplasmataceae archaeon]